MSLTVADATPPAGGGGGSSAITDVAVKEEIEDDGYVNMSQHLFDQISTFTNAETAYEDKISKSKNLKPYLGEVDGFLSFDSQSSEGKWPVLEWTSHFRKAYNLLLWVRPVITEEEIHTTILEDTTPQRRILYRLATSPEDHSGVGVCVTVGEWRKVITAAEDNDAEERSGKGNSANWNNNKNGKGRVTTTLTAYSLPFSHTNPLENDFDTSTELGGSSSHFVTAQLELPENEWSLVGITHVFPYLKRPHWTLCVNGRITSSGELAYPVLEKTPVLSFNTLFQNICQGGCQIIDDSKPDFKKKASELQTQVYPRYELKLHLASFCLASEAFSPTIQALLAQAGPALSLSSGGCIPILPPVANWTKGSSLEGPNVGIPLVVHGQALTVQQLAHSCVLWGSAVEARLLGGRNDPTKNRVQRIVCRMTPKRGTTHTAPRVGLVQPTPPNSGSSQISRTSTADIVGGSTGEEDPTSLTILGSCSIHHNLSDYLLKSPDVTNVDTQLFSSTKYFSLLLAGQALDCHLILPFFLALPPPGTTMELQVKLQTNSIRHLYDLYKNNGAFACHLIDLLTTSIATCGGRWQEQLLQNGTLHVLASALRQSLVRAEYLQVDKYETYGDFVKAHHGTTTGGSSSGKKFTTTMSHLPVSPSKIPLPVAEAMARLIDTCCGPAASFLEDLDPCKQIQRTSDLALTALFGIGLDWELWGKDLDATVIMLEAIAGRYGGNCVTAGYILRSQISVQYFLDTMRMPMSKATDRGGNGNSNEDKTDVLERIANACASILQAMLLSSLSNMRSISQGEHDVSACLGALSDCPLGSVGAHVIFSAIMGVLEWCDVIPASTFTSKKVGAGAPSRKVDDDLKCQVANRLARNLLMGQFHDVIAPMLLSRTVFCGERTMSVDQGNNPAPLSWEWHWRLGLLTFAWVATIAGPGGVIAAKSLGSLMLASGLAGSLRGALDEADKSIMTNMLLPPPSMALTLAASSRKSEWSYTDLLSERLQIMMPLLPGLVVSLVSHPSDAEKSDNKTMSSKSLTSLTELITSVGGSFYRVFGGLTHSAGSPSHGKRNRSVDNAAVATAKVYIPHLLVVAIILENHIELRKRPQGDAVPILETPAMVQTGAEDGSWVEVSSTVNDSFLSDGVVKLPEGVGSDTVEAVVEVLQANQNSVLTTISELMSNAMKAGGGEVSTHLWRNLLVTVSESASYAAREFNSKEENPAHNVLCRLTAMVLNKCLKRDYQWEVWQAATSSAVSRLCLLIEEKELLARPLRSENRYTDDQVLLLCTMLSILSYGRDTTGWCQLILPSPPLPSPGPGDSKSFGRKEKGNDSAPASSKLMLPVLQPSLRVAEEVIGRLHSDIQIKAPAPSTQANSESDDSQVASLLDHVLDELRQSLTAAIVGLSFPNARDVALHSMATVRRALKSYENSSDVKGLELCTGLLCMVSEEIRVRYEGERRRRETALFDAYEEDEDGDKKARSDAAAQSQEIENMILGGDLLSESQREKDAVEEVSFETEANDTVKTTDKKRPTKGDDFVLFHDGPMHSSEQSPAKMQWNRYEGLGVALEECKMGMESESSEDVAQPKAKGDDIIKVLSPFLDAWDESTAVEAADTELVKLFDFNIQPSSSDENSTNKSENELGIDGRMRLQGSESAADSMSTFIEFAAAEKSRLTEVAHSFLPNHRYSCISYTERFCWARYVEISRDSKMNDIFERGIADGNRDVRSRLVTIPCSPQFRRFIPKYLDHSGEHDDSSGPGGNEGPSVDEFTKSLLETGHLQIVDITKKEVNVEDEPELDLARAESALDDDFSERPMEAPAPNDKSATGKDGDTASETASATDATATTEATSKPDDDPFDKTKIASSHYNFTASAFASPPDNSSSTLSLMHSAAAGLIEKHLENCLHVKAEGTRKCSLLLTSTHLILEYDIDAEGLYEGEMMAVREEAERQKMIEDAGGAQEEKIQEEIERRQREAAALRPRSIRWNLSELSHVYLRRYRLRDSSVEMFFIPSGGTSFGGYGLYSPSTSLFLDFGPGYEGNSRRDDAAFAIMKRAPPQAIKQWPDRSAQFLHEQLSRLTMGWVEGRITNFDYLLHLNMLAGRSYNDTCQYPVMPWVLSNYKSEEIPDLCDPNNFRDLSKPMGAINPDRLEDFIERFNTFADPSIPPFMYGSHYSTNAGVVLHFLVRLHPFSSLHRQLQGGHFDVADRLFSSVPRTWEMCTGSSAAEVKELTPEWYCNPAFLKNSNKFKLGTSQDGEILGDVDLPAWAQGSPERFVEVMRNALESDICSNMLPDWIDLIFGRKQQGPEAIAAHNVFFYLTYYGSVDVAAIEDEGLRQATELQIAHFGQCPMQLFVRPHVRRIQQVNRKRMSFYQVTSAYTQGVGRDGEANFSGISEQRMNNSQVFGQPLYLPFFSAPISHWVHLDAPPPGPHAHLLCVRLAGTDRCLAVDAQGVFHCFRWAWKAEEGTHIEGTGGVGRFPIDSGCFIAQRELPRFRTVPRLVHRPRPDELPAVAVSKTLFAGRSVLLVLSDGDGRGGLAMQLVDPSKGSVRGEAVVGSVHSSQILCIATDPIGTAAGHGGVGGELAIVGASDGGASIWRFMSSHYLPLRPRVQLSGHSGAPIHAVGLSAAINVAATVSKRRLCLHSIGNGNLIRVIEPPSDALDMPEGCTTVTNFASSPALAISVQGFVATVCETTIGKSGSSSHRSVVTLHLFSLEGVSLGSKPLESWRGVPHKMSCTPDGTAVLVCSGRGVTIHRLSAITPLEFIDEWHVTETDELTPNVARAWDIDLGPSLNRPVVAAAACSNGALRLHALSGISAFSERHKKIGLSNTVGNILSVPGRRIKNAVGKGWGIGSKVVGVGKEIGQEVSSDVKERGVGGFLGNMFGRKKDSKG